MLEVNGNLWDFHNRGYHVVVTTNAGWDVNPFWAPPACPVLSEREPGSRPAWNNMGAGSVLEAWRKHPTLSEWYGRRCRFYALQTLEHGEAEEERVHRIGSPDAPYFRTTRLPVLKRDDLRLVFLPVKPVIWRAPQTSWDQKADLLYIEKGLKQLGHWYRGTFGRPGAPKVAMTLPGAGNGGLDPREVRALVRRELGDTGICLVDYQLKVAR